LPTALKRTENLVTGALSVLLIGATLVLLQNIYSHALDFQLFGIRIRSTQWLRPALVTLASWLALARLKPRLQPTGDFWVVLACLGAYSWTFHRPYSLDVTPTGYTALAIATGRGTSLDAYPEFLQYGVTYFLHDSPQGLRSNYPVGPALLAWPPFVLAPFSNLPRPELVERLSIVSAIGIGGACVWLALQILKRLNAPFSPRLLALAYGLGTTHWSTSSSALWQHGPGELWILGAVERLTDRETSVRRRLLALGFCLAMAVVTRPSLALSAAVVFALTIYFYGKRSLHAVASGTGAVTPVLAYHLEIYGSLLGPYAAQTHAVVIRPIAEWLDTMFWLMASPSRGVLWYEPVVVLTLVAALVKVVRLVWAVVRGRPGRFDVFLWAGLLGFFMTLALYGCWVSWWGGYSFGPRLMTDSLPWWLLIAGSMGTVSAGIKRLVVPLTAVGSLVSYMGAFGNPVMWDGRPHIDLFPERLRSFGDSQLVTAALATLGGDTLTRQAVYADTSQQYEKARDLWAAEWRQHRWHRFAANRTADLLLRTDRFAEADAHVKAMQTHWPESSYVRHLAQRLPAIVEMLQEPSWSVPLAATALPNPGRAIYVRDGRLRTSWTTERPQAEGDWLELGVDERVRVRGVAIFFAPEFGEGPATLRAVGRTLADEAVDLATLEVIYAARKGWIVVRFSPRHLKSVTLSLLGPRAPPWTVTEARIIIAEADLDRTGDGLDEPSKERGTARQLIHEDVLRRRVRPVADGAESIESRHAERGREVSVRTAAR